MSKQPDPSAFGNFVPGFDFLQKLAQGGPANMAAWLAPTLDAQALDKRIDELKTVQFWLDQNAAALKATIQALEVQKMTLATLRTMSVPMPGGAGWSQAVTPAAAAPAAKARPARSRRQPAEPPPAAAAMPDPMQFWGALTRQFQQIAAEALKDVATAPAPASAPAGRADPKPARKTAAARSREKG